MSAALTELVSKGAQDVYITGDPQVSFFHQNYKRHTNFAIKPERLDYIGTFGAGNEISIPLRTKGDLRIFPLDRWTGGNQTRFPFHPGCAQSLVQTGSG